MANLGRVLAIVGGITIVGMMTYLYIGTPSRKSPERFKLVPDLPPNEISVSSTPNSEKDQAAQKQIRIAIRQRLLDAYGTLAYADSGKWHLATWAQLQWVRDSLDGAGLENIQGGRNVDPSLRDFSFVRLLNELVRTAPPDQKQAATDARTEGIAIIDELAAMTPITKDPSATLKHVVLEIQSSPGLHLLATDFPRFKKIPLPKDDY